MTEPSPGPAAGIELHLGTVMQIIDAARYRGTRVCFSGVLSAINE